MDTDRAKNAPGSVRSARQRATASSKSVGAPGRPSR